MRALGAEKSEKQKKILKREISGRESTENSAGEGNRELSGENAELSGGRTP